MLACILEMGCHPCIRKAILTTKIQFSADANHGASVHALNSVINMIHVASTIFECTHLKKSSSIICIFVER